MSTEGRTELIALGPLGVREHERIRRWSLPGIQNGCGPPRVRSGLAHGFGLAGQADDGP